VHCGKTVHAARAAEGGSASDQLPAIRLADGEAGVVRNVLPPKEPFRLLGAWLSLDGRGHPVFDKIETSVKGTCRLLRRKAISSEIATYVVNAVMLPAVAHRATATPLAAHYCSQLDACWMKLVKRKARFASSSSNELFWAKEGFGVRRTQDVLDEAQIADLQRRLDHPGLLGRAARVQERAARSVTRELRSPYVSFSGTSLRSCVFALHLAHRISERDAQVAKGRKWTPTTDAAKVATADAAPRGLYRQISEQCRRYGLHRMQDLAAFPPAGTPTLYRFSHLARTDEPGRCQQGAMGQARQVRRRRSRTYRRTPRKGPHKWYQLLKEAWPQMRERAEQLAAAARRAQTGRARLVKPLTAKHLKESLLDPDGVQQDWGAAAEATTTGTLEVWTDGSVQSPQSDDRHGGYAVVLLKDDAEREEQGLPAAAAAVAAGRYEGPHCHSDMLEALAVAHALYGVPPDRDIRILTDSMTCVRWWRCYIEKSAPWEVARRRATATYKVWEMIAERVNERAGRATIEWVKAHAGTRGNELADKLAKAASEAKDTLPVWTLNTSPAPVTDHNLLLAGVNFLESPLAVLRKQSEMRHSAALRKLLVDRHPSLEQRLPPALMRPLIPARRSAGAAATEAKDKPANQLEEDYDRELRRREFGLKLATGTLPTLDRQHRWYSRAYQDARCCRCDAGVLENWEHVLCCPGNEVGVLEEVRARSIAAAKEAVCTINGARVKENDPRRPVLNMHEIAEVATPCSPAADIGFLLGQPDKTAIAELKQRRLRQAEMNRVIEAASTAALEAVWTCIWKPRCEAVTERLDTWRQRSQEAANAQTGQRATGPPSSADPPRRARSTASASAGAWTDINRRLLQADRLRPLVAPSWCP